MDPLRAGLAGDQGPGPEVHRLDGEEQRTLMDGEVCVYSGPASDSKISPFR
jgi:hypothetical protein